MASRIISSVPFRYRGIHACKYLVYACMDFRFIVELFGFINYDLGLQDYDLVLLPGPPKTIIEKALAKPEGVVAQALHVSLEAHAAHKIFIINHADCLAEGGRGVFKTIDREREYRDNRLFHAQDILKHKYPRASVSLADADLTAGEDMIQFREVA